MNAEERKTLSDQKKTCITRGDGGTRGERRVSWRWRTADPNGRLFNFFGFVSRKEVCSGGKREKFKKVLCCRVEVFFFVVFFKFLSFQRLYYSLSYFFSSNVLTSGTFHTAVPSNVTVRYRFHSNDLHSDVYLIDSTCRVDVVKGEVFHVFTEGVSSVSG